MNSTGRYLKNRRKKEQHEVGVTCFGCGHDEYGPTWENPGKIEMREADGETYPLCPECGVPAQFFDYRDGL